MINPIILASSSPFRAELLRRLKIDFECISPDIDESQLPNESASEYVQRLAKSKALEISKNHPDAIIIGSDQCALLGNEILGKPGNHANAAEQLRSMSSNKVVFHTGLCVIHTSDYFEEVDEVLYEVDIRQLTDAQINNYLLREKPYQCAGSFKSEGYGIALFSAMRGTDPTALIGLPLIRLTGMLEKAGIEIL